MYIALIKCTQVSFDSKVLINYISPGPMYVYSALLRLIKIGILRIIEQSNILLKQSDSLDCKSDHATGYNWMTKYI